MARSKGSKQVLLERRKCVHDMKTASLRVKDIADYCSMPRSTVSNIVRWYNNEKHLHEMKKRGRKFKLPPCALRMFRNYVVSNCFDPLFVIVRKFAYDTGIKLSVSTGRRYIKKLRMSSHIAVQKPFKTLRHLLARLKWARMQEGWTAEQ